MTYTISVQPLSPRMDTLPTYKIIDYPLEKRDYKPFAQAKLCVTPTEFIIQMWSFEAFPKEESMLKAVFTTHGMEKLLVAETLANGNSSFYIRDTHGDKNISVIASSLNGEDLQGDFWGVEVRFPREVIEENFGVGSLDIGASILGNFYKLSENVDKPHKGSLHPADFISGKEYSLGSMAEFAIVNY